MNIAVVLNGVSRKKRFFYQEIYPLLRERFDIKVFETQYANHGIELAHNAASEKFNYVFAAGGDGTLHQVLNGVLQNQNGASSTAIGIIPLGTGNDFSRTCGIKPNANQIANLIIENNPKPTDVGKIICKDDNDMERTRHFINVCSIGMGPEVVKRLVNSDRSLGPLLTYLKAITTTFFSHKAQEVVIQSSDWQWKGKMRVAAIANGKSFGNAMFIAPDARMDDGQFSTFVAGDLPLLRFLYCLQKIKGKVKVKDQLIQYNHCKTVEITSPNPCPIEAEGELVGLLPMKIEIIPQRIKFLR